MQPLIPSCQTCCRMWPWYCGGMMVSSLWGWDSIERHAWLRTQPLPPSVWTLCWKDAQTGGKGEDYAVCQTLFHLHQITVETTPLKTGLPKSGKKIPSPQKGKKGHCKEKNVVQKGKWGWPLGWNPERSSCASSTILAPPPPPYQNT